MKTLYYNNFSSSYRKSLDELDPSYSSRRENQTHMFIKYKFHSYQLNQSLLVLDLNNTFDEKEKSQKLRKIEKEKTYCLFRWTLTKLILNKI